LPRLYLFIIVVFVVFAFVVFVEVVVVLVIRIIRIIIVESISIHKWRQIQMIHDVGSAGLIFSRFGGGYVDQKWRPQRGHTQN
jgi:hypothetical protein